MNVDKPAKTYPQPLASFVRRALGDVFARQGFASGELITRWPAIVGAEVAALAEPMKLQWPRGAAAEPSEPATLVLRVEGPAAIEVQHLAPVILERINRFLGWRAVARIAIRQAPLKWSAPPVRRPAPSAAEVESATASLTGVTDEPLRAALGRLGAAVRRP